MRNPYAEDLVYLTGGERRDVEIAGYPRLGLVMVRNGADATLFSEASAKKMNPVVGED